MPRDLTLKALQTRDLKSERINGVIRDRLSFVSVSRRSIAYLGLI